MKFIKKLSENWVELYSFNNKLLVKRFFTKEQIRRILEFYQDSTFSYKPKIIEINEQEKFIIEEFLEWKELINPNYNENRKIIESLLELSEEKLWEKVLEEYIEHSFDQKISSIKLNEEYKRVVNNLFIDIKSLALDVKLNLNWTHWDLKGDNIILSSNQAYIIDWEWLKKWHYVEDIQKFISKTLEYDEIKTDYFLNNFYKYKSINWKLFIFLETFHYFLDEILQLSKDRISIDDFKELVENKINLMINNNIY